MNVAEKFSHVPISDNDTALVQIHGFMLILGYVISGWVGYGFYFWAEGGNSVWRVPLALQGVWPLTLLCGLHWVPESPRWLVMNDRVPEARAILEKLHSHAKTLDNEYALAELYQIQKQVVIDRTLPSSWVHMFKKSSYRKRAFLAMGTTGILLPL